MHSMRLSIMINRNCISAFEISSHIFHILIKKTTENEIGDNFVDKFLARFSFDGMSEKGKGSVK